MYNYIVIIGYKFATHHLVLQSSVLMQKLYMQLLGNTFVTTDRRQYFLPNGNYITNVLSIVLLAYIGKVVI